MRTIALVTLFTRLACAQITQHVTDLSIFNLLAPCASSAVFYNVEALTDSTGLGCGTAELRLQSCICSQSDVSSQVAQNVSEGIQSECGESATGDLWSASQVLKQYCSPGETITFSTPTTNVVTQYITDIDKMNFLAPCAYSGLSWAVMYSVLHLVATDRRRTLQASSHCPKSASLYALCVCSKGDVELIHSEG